jgi:hypothetical protein
MVCEAIISRQERRSESDRKVKRWKSEKVKK